MRLTPIFLFSFCFFGSYGQTGVNVLYVGLMDHIVPIQFELQSIEDRMFGVITFDDSEYTISLEGDVQTDRQQIELYEYDSYGRVQGIIKGQINDDRGELFWTDVKYERKIPFTLKLKNNRDNKLYYLTNQKLGENFKYAFLRPGDQHISINKYKNMGLRWMRYNCENEYCVELRLNQDLSNPLEFSFSELEKEKSIFLFPSEKLSLGAELSQANVSAIGHSGYASINYPVLGQSQFDNWLKSEVERRMNVMKSQLNRDPDFEAISRLEYFGQGDYFITLLTDELISGYLYFLNSDESRVETIPFSYDRSRSKLLLVNDLFKKDFDYAFFLNRYLEKAKKNLLLTEDRMMRSLIDKAIFSHLVIVPSGLLFFTDFNSFYGRRHILVPFDNISTFLNSKSIESFIKKMEKL